MEDAVKSRGILPSQSLREFVRDGNISSLGADITEDQIQPSSIDLRLGPVAYRLRASFLPGMRSVKEMIESTELLDCRIDLTKPALLKPDEIYVVPLLERLELPDDVAGVANPKSTTGRLDIFTRLITESGQDDVEFERVPKGYRGALYLEIATRTFKVWAQEGLRLNQLRLTRGKQEPIGIEPLKKLGRTSQVLFGEDDDRPGIRRRGLPLTVDLEGDDSGVVAYQANKDAPPLDISKINHYDLRQFWFPIARPRTGHIILDPKEFYILASKERVRVPNDLAAEMIPYDPAMGEFRVHYAGFFDPGFGYGADGEIPGSKAVLEVRVYEVPFLLEHGRMVGRLNYFNMADPPDKVYGGKGSNYQQQGLTLAKQFKRPVIDHPKDAPTEFRLVPAHMQPIL